MGDLVSHELLAQEDFGEEGVVGLAEDSEVVGFVAAGLAMGIGVVDFDVASFLAPSAVGADVGALVVVSIDDFVSAGDGDLLSWALALGGWPGVGRGRLFGWLLGWFLS